MPETPITEPVDPVVEPVDPVVEPVVEPADPVAEPETPVAEPEIPEEELAEELGEPADLDNLNMETEKVLDTAIQKVECICNHLVRFKDNSGKEFQVAPKQVKDVKGVSKGMIKLIEKKMIKIL